MEIKQQRYVGVACLTLALSISLSHFILVSPKTHSFFTSFSSSPASQPSSFEQAETKLAAISPLQDPILSEKNLLKEEMPSPVQENMALGTPQIKKETLYISRGATLDALLRGAGISKQEVQRALAALKPVYNTRELKAGQDISITYRHGPDQSFQLVNLSFYPDLGKSISLSLNDEGKFKATTQKTPLQKELKKVGFNIQSSLLASATANGLPSRLITPLIRAFSYDIDFQRDIKKGDKFSVVFERHFDPKTGRDKIGDVLYAQIHPSNRNKPVQIYRFTQNGKVAFYNEFGQSIQKDLMRTPINGASIRSGFGNRRHPIYGFTKKHEGVDFGAPTGTLIFAAGAGVVKKACYNKGLGKYILIQHNKEYATAYGHLSKFAKNIRPGYKVAQGTPIGYVGQTGHATGPHLHFEVHRNGVKVNPMRVANLSSGKLSGQELKKFMAAKRSIDQQMAKISENKKFALNMPENTLVSEA